MSMVLAPEKVGTTAPHIRTEVPITGGYRSDTAVGVFLDQCERLGDLVGFRSHDGTGWVSLTWAEMEKRVRRVAAGLIGAGVKARDTVIILSPNRIEWGIVDAAIQAAGAIPVPVYPTLVPETVQYIADDAGAVMAVVSGDAMAAKLTITPVLQSIVRMDGEVQEWMATEVDPDTGVELERRIQGVTPAQTCTIIYTSGTTGMPKGVVLTHANFVENARSGLKVFDIGPDDVGLAFLPLAHVLQRHSGLFIMVTAGAQSVLGRGMERLMDDLHEVRPTVMLGMPRLFDIVYQRVHEEVNHSSALKKRLYYWAEGVGRRMLRAGDSADAWLRFQHGLAKSLVLNSVREKTTGGKLRFFISGGAPLNPEVEEFFWAMGVQILQGWGLTETTSGATSNTERDHRYKSVGKPLPGTEVKVAPDGELLVRGPGVMKEYFHKPDATAETFEGEWFKTGDIGQLDEDGFVYITDRKKELIKTAGGKYVAPLPLETRLQSDRYIRSALLIGDQRPYVTALIVPNTDNLKADHGIVGEAADVVKDSRVFTIIKEHLDLLNHELASFETIKHFSLIPDDFSIERDELTPTLKPKRRVIVDHYKAVIDAMYEAATAAYKKQKELEAAGK